MSRYTDAVHALRCKIELDGIPTQDALDDVISRMELGLVEISQLTRNAISYYGGGSEDK